MFQPRSIHKGIVGIERKLEEKRKETDQNISKVRQMNTQDYDIVILYL